jgi:hypothetical protein
VGGSIVVDMAHVNAALQWSDDRFERRNSFSERRCGAEKRREKTDKIVAEYK